MKKIDIEKLREQLRKSQSQRVVIAFDDSVDLAAAAKETSDAGGEYIEIEGWASTTKKNDRGFRISASTWTKATAFERLKTNPMVLFNHDLNYPIGQVTGWESREEGLWVKIRLRYNAVLPTQEKLGDVVKDRTLRALSLGIDILDLEVIELPDDAGYDFVVTEVQIGEVTLCSVPSDPGAITDLCEQLSTAYNLASITDESEKGGNTMWKLLAKKYGMDPEKVTEEQVMAEYNRREQLGSTAIVGLGLDPTNLTADALTAALAARDPKKLQDLQAANAKLVAEGLVTGAILSKKIAENDEDTKKWALSYAEKDPEGFKAWASLQKETAPDTRRIAPGSGAATGGSTTPGASPFITKEDREVCLKFGKFKTPEEMDKMAETTPNEALGWVLGQSYPMTEADREVVQNRRKWDNACGIPARD